jgi:hypothetical protein
VWGSPIDDAIRCLKKGSIPTGVGEPCLAEVTAPPLPETKSKPDLILPV